MGPWALGWRCTLLSQSRGSLSVQELVAVKRVAALSGTHDGRTAGRVENRGGREKEAKRETRERQSERGGERGK